ncbi:MAG: hypothetical protein ACYDER_07960 [Ktedonobacteraceae bacterium]
MTGTALWHWIQQDHLVLAGIVLALFIGIGLMTWIKTVRAERRSRSHGNHPPIYAVGSPEYNAQVVAAIRQVNERLAPEGKRVPERTAIDIIRQATGQDGSERTRTSDETRKDE